MVSIVRRQRPMDTFITFILSISDVRILEPIGGAAVSLRFTYTLAAM